MGDVNARRNNRSAATDEDGAEPLGFETPRSGLATPRPDPYDKRLPGIMSYFTQVRPSSLQRLLSGSFVKAGSQSAAETPTPPPASRSDKPAAHPQGCHPPDDGPYLLPHEILGPPPGEALHEDAEIHSYPTPPTSQRSSLRTSVSLLSSNQPVTLVSPPASRPCSLRQASATDWTRGPAPRPSTLAPLTSAVNADGSSGRPSTEPNSPTWSHAAGAEGEGDNKVSAVKSASVTHLQKLTGLGVQKSGQNTPRALSVAHPSQAEHHDGGAHPPNGEGLHRSAVLAAITNGAQAPAAKGKLTVKIVEARGLRNCKEPYVVAVFQRSELISPGPRPVVEDKEHAITSIPISGGGGMGGVPISRQGSDSGRPMAIPMRSRQSSNTSITDRTAFRNRPRSMTNPKWDAEAVFDVVDSDMLVDLSVYDHQSDGQSETFLGHVDFEARPKDKDGRVRGWFSLRGNADTVAGDAPTGEIYVEALYQRAERKHFGPDDFKIIRLIGKGTFGQVYQVCKKDTGRIYAMKVLSKKVIVQKKEVAHTVGERNILVRTAMTDSPFIVGLKFSFQTPSDLYLVTDYMSGGELFWHLQKEGKFDEKRAKFYIAELILAIEHLHKNDIVYRDLKPENILLDANGHIALCDFGLSKANLTKGDTTNTFCGTTEYLAPEVLLDEAGYTKMVDFWSLGVLVFEMCCGWSPFYAEDTQQMYKNIAFGKVRFPRDTLSLEGRNFVKGLLNRNPRHRLGATDDAAELKRHAFFQDVDWDALSKKLMTPPFKPQLKDALDVSYFDPEFTNAMVTNGSLNERALALARGYAASTPLSPTVQANFHGFTYVDESTLDDLMRGRFDDEEMDDASDRGGRRDDEWDDLRDVEFRRGGGNRMSGIEKTTTAAAGEENMINDPSFD